MTIQDQSAAPLPNFLIIGAQKSGTTSLYHYLKQHPQVFMSSVKEPHFFTYEGQPPPAPYMVTDFGAYQQLFSDAGNAIAIGEASPSYLHGAGVPQRIVERLPNVRLIAILRNPIDRAFSNWVHNVSFSREPHDFENALRAEPDRRRRGESYAYWYIYKGLYHQHLSRFIDVFDRGSLKVVFFEDLKRDPFEVTADIFEFLGVDSSFRPHLEQHNVSGVPKGRLGEVLNTLRRRPAVEGIGKRLVPEYVRNWLRARLLVRPQLEEVVRQSLYVEFREDILKLQDLVGRDLSHWLGEV